MGVPLRPSFGPCELSVDHWSNCRDCMFWISNAGFCLTGIAATLIVQWLDYHGLSKATTGLSILPMFVGQAGCAVILFRDPGGRRRYHPMFFPLAFLNLVGETLCQVCIIQAGSGLYTVLYSSVTVFTALIKWKLLHVSLKWLQWLSIAVIVIGLSVSAADDSSSGNNVTDKVVGIASGIIAAMFYGGYYVLSDAIVNGTYGTDEAATAPEPATVAAFVGLLNSLIIGLYICLFDGPQWEDLIASKVREQHTEFTTLMLLYLALICIQGTHILFFFIVAKTSGAVAAAVNKAVQSVSIFGLSALIYCDHHDEQCFTVAKGIATALVIGGVLGYGFFGQKPEDSHNGFISKDDADETDYIEMPQDLDQDAN